MFCSVVSRHYNFKVAAIHYFIVMPYITSGICHYYAVHSLHWRPIQINLLKYDVKLHYSNSNPLFKSYYNLGTYGSPLCNTDDAGQSNNLHAKELHAIISTVLLLNDTNWFLYPYAVIQYAVTWYMVCIGTISCMHS